MNGFTRVALLIVAAVLVPGGFVLLVPVIYRWLKRRRKLAPPAHDVEPA